MEKQWNGLFLLKELNSLWRFFCSLNDAANTKELQPQPNSRMVVLLVRVIKLYSDSSSYISGAFRYYCRSHGSSGHVSAKVCKFI